jgi:hypothetical protein
MLHANTARALRRAELTARQATRLRARVLSMLADGNVRQEFKQYAKLVRPIGLGSDWEQARRRADKTNRYVKRWVAYFDAVAAEENDSR